MITIFETSRFSHAAQVFAHSLGQYLDKNKAVPVTDAEIPALKALADTANKANVTKLYLDKNRINSDFCDNHVRRLVEILKLSNVDELVISDITWLENSFSIFSNSLAALKLQVLEISAFIKNLAPLIENLPLTQLKKLKLERMIKADNNLLDLAKALPLSLSHFTVKTHDIDFSYESQIEFLKILNSKKVFFLGIDDRFSESKMVVFCEALKKETAIRSLDLYGTVDNYLFKILFENLIDSQVNYLRLQAWSYISKNTAAELLPIILQTNLMQIKEGLTGGKPTPIDAVLLQRNPYQWGVELAFCLDEHLIKDLIGTITDYLFDEEFAKQAKVGLHDPKKVRNLETTQSLLNAFNKPKVTEVEEAPTVSSAYKTKAKKQKI